MSFLILQSLRCDVGRYFAEIVHNLKSNIRSLRDVRNELKDGVKWSSKLNRL